MYIRYNKLNVHLLVTDRGPRLGVTQRHFKIKLTRYYAWIGDPDVVSFFYVIKHHVFSTNYAPNSPDVFKASEPYGRFCNSVS